MYHRSETSETINSISNKNNFITVDVNQTGSDELKGHGVSESVCEYIMIVMLIFVIKQFKDIKRVPYLF